MMKKKLYIFIVIILSFLIFATYKIFVENKTIVEKDTILAMDTQISGIHFLVWIEIPCQIFLYKKEDICCPLVIQSIHHKNHERRLNKCPIMILS